MNDCNITHTSKTVITVRLSWFARLTVILLFAIGSQFYRVGEWIIGVKQHE